MSSKTELTEDKIQWMTETIQRANSGDQSALADVRKILDQFPEMLESIGGDLGKVAEDALVEAASGERLATAEAMRRKSRSLERELAGADPSPIEKLLVQRIVVCWLQVAHADCLSAQADDVPVSHANYLQRNQDQAHRRLLSSIKTLATVRRMASPVQVNVDVKVEEDSPPDLGIGRWPFAAMDNGGNRLRSFAASDS